MTFQITDHVEFSSNGRAVCPSCERDGKGKKQNLSLIPDTDGAYKCHRGCTPADIREALRHSENNASPSLASPEDTPQTHPAHTAKSQSSAHQAHRIGRSSKEMANRERHHRRDNRPSQARHRTNQTRRRQTMGHQHSMLSDGGTTYHVKKRVAHGMQLSQSMRPTKHGSNMAFLSECG